MRSGRRLDRVSSGINFHASSQEFTHHQELPAGRVVVGFEARHDRRGLGTHDPCRLPSSIPPAPGGFDLHRFLTGAPSASAYFRRKREMSAVHDAGHGEQRLLEAQEDIHVLRQQQVARGAVGSLSGKVPMPLLQRAHRVVAQNPPRELMPHPALALPPGSAASQA